MNAIVSASNLEKRFGNLAAVDRVSLQIKPGTITGLVGPNGAGKTTLLRALLGLNASSGQLQVMGLDPRRQRSRLLEHASFIADTALLPGWMRVDELLDYVAGVHPGFDREQAERLLSQTEVGPKRRIKTLSKGMNVQLHLALVMSIDARLLVLDEPTLGLDILFRKRFFEQLLNDYYDEQRTIVISTHQVEEVEHILTDVIFMRAGRIVLHESMDSIAQRFVELKVVGDAVQQAASLQPIHERAILGGKAFIFEDADRDRLRAIGELHTPAVADLFVAKMARDS